MSRTLLPIVGSTGTRHRSSPSSRNARRALLRAAIRAEVGRVEGLVVGLRQPDPTDGAVIVEWAIERSRRNVDLSHASSDAHRPQSSAGAAPGGAGSQAAGGEGALLRPCHARSSRERGRYVPQCSFSAVRATRQARHETGSIREAAKLRRLLAIRETSESHRSARSLSLPWTTQIDVRCGRTGLDLLYFSLLR
jgi:hypothetical protein